MTRMGLTVLALATLVLVVVDGLLLSPWLIPLVAVPIVIILLLVWNVDG